MGQQSGHMINNNETLIGPWTEDITKYPCDDEDKKARSELYIFKSHGFDCYIERNEKKIWCGYVKLPKDHPYYETNDYINNELNKNIKTHGELCKKEEIFGFCCNLLTDIIPYENISIIDKNKTYKDYNYVIVMTRDLAYQFSQIYNKKN